MCRWLAYSGVPIRIEDLLYRPRHSLIDQSLHSRLGVETTNGDGFGVGWYGAEPDRPPALFRGTGPAWSDANLREVAGAVASPMFLAHVRASTGTAVQQTNCHPFRNGSWLWVHNGEIRSFPTVKRDLVLRIDPDLFVTMAGSTDSEVMFHLALTFGLREEPVGAVERMVGFVEDVCRSHGIADPVQMTVAAADGHRIWTFRYSTEGRSRTLFFSTDVSALRALYPADAELGHLSDDTRIVVSEPLVDLAGEWQPMPEASYGYVHGAADDIGDFRPRLP